MSDAGRCPQCGCELPGNALSGLCPRCLLKVGFDEPSQVPTGPKVEAAPKSADGGFVPPTPEELSIFIPQIEFLELLGKGGMGAVYKGRQKSLDRLVAVKILPPHIANDSNFAERFTREARTLGKLNHPNIVAIHDSGHSNGLYYFVMEFVEGANVRQLMREKMFTPKDALGIVPQICDALQFAHDEGVVHRDIKPENILIDKKGRVKIADFGLAKLMGQEQIEGNLTATHQVMGTMKYMAPEQMEGAKDIDHRADIYSLGVVFYELLTGELPLGRFAPPSRKVQIDVRLDEIVLRALEKEPNHRYQHAGEVKSEVETVVRTPNEAQSRAHAVVENEAAKTKSGKDRISSWIRHFVAEFDEIDLPYVCWVVIPTIGFAGFCLFAIMISAPRMAPTHGDEMFEVGLGFTFVAFILLNALWLVCRAFRIIAAPPARPWTPEQVARQLRRSARLLNVTGVLTVVSWFAVWPFLETAGIFLLLAILLGVTICIGARDITKNRDPGTFIMLLVMMPLSPAIVIGLPVGLQTLRIFGRPEVKAFLEAKS